MHWHLGGFRVAIGHGIPGEARSIISGRRTRPSEGASGGSRRATPSWKPGEESSPGHIGDQMPVGRDIRPPDHREEAGGGAAPSVWLATAGDRLSVGALSRVGARTVCLAWLLMMAAGLVSISSVGGEAKLTPQGALNPKGERVRALGVNYYDAFTRTLASGNDTSYDAGFATLAEHRIPFVRLSVTGYWPVDMALYQTNRNEYFRRMDGVVRSAARHGIGLIPSLFWYYATVPDLMGEPMQAWGKPGSRTTAFLKEYTREVVGRYAGTPVIWAWEFGNEFNLACDLPNAAEHRPPIHSALGTASERSAKDELRYEDLKRALATFAETVREFDKDRLITSGDAVLRTSAWNNRHRRSWTRDTSEQSLEILGDLMGRGLGLVSVHLYGEDLPRLEASAGASRRLNRPLFVGEFQFTTPGKDGARAEFERFLDRLERERVLLAAVWVFDFASQAADYSITAGNERAWQLGLLRERNQRLGW